KPTVHHTVTNTNEKLFQMNFRRSQIIFPCANLWNSFHFFPKVSVADSQIPSLPINSRIFLFLHAQKAYSWINYLLPSYPIKNIRIFLFLLYTKSVFVHFFMVTT